MTGALFRPPATRLVVLGFGALKQPAEQILRAAAADCSSLVAAQFDRDSPRVTFRAIHGRTAPGEHERYRTSPDIATKRKIDRRRAVAPARSQREGQSS